MSNADPRGKFVWHELLTTDAAAAGAFYPKVVSWKAQPWERDASYTLWVGKNGPVGGVMSLPVDSTAAPHWLPYVGVADAAATVAQAKALGATVQKDTTEMPNMGKYAVLADPQGAAFAVYQSAEPHDPAAGVGGFSWHELTTSDPEAALAFYAKLFGWEVGPTHDMGPIGLYHLFLHNGAQYGGAMASPNGDAPNWMCYVTVEDIDKAANSVKSAGGRLLNGPIEVPGGSWVAQVMDPAGAPFAVHEPAAAATAQQPAAKPAAAPKPKAPKPEAKPAAAAPPAAKPAAAAAPAPAAPKPAAKSAPKPAVKAKKKAPPKRKAAAKKAAKKAPAKARKKASKKVVAKKAAKKKSAAKRAPAKKKAPARSPRRAKAKKHR